MADILSNAFHCLSRFFPPGAWLVHNTCTKSIMTDSLHIISISCLSVGCSHFRVYHGLLWAFTFVNHSQIIGAGFQQYTQIIKRRRPLPLSREYKFHALFDENCHLFKSLVSFRAQ